MVARRLSWGGAAISLLLAGCVVEQNEFAALRDQVRIQQKQINDLKARQEEQGLRIDTLNNGFKILGDKAEENARRIDELGAPGAAAPAAAVPAVAISPPAPEPATAAEALALPPARTVPAPAPEAPAPPVAPSVLSEGPVLLTNLPKAAPAGTPPEGEIITAAPKAEQLYTGALKLYSVRDYQQAIAKFEEFLAGYRDHKLAGNAQYWIGECYYSQRRFLEASEAFAQVERSYPTSPKVPAALLKKGLSLAELKKMPEAQAALQQIVEKYAQSEEATKARERLERWKQP